MPSPQIIAACLAVGAFQPTAAWSQQPAPAPTAEASEVSLAGAWSGAIVVPGGELKVQLHFESTNGEWQGTIDIPAQSARGLPLQNITVEGPAVSFELAGIPGAPTFRGTLDPAAGITGDFSQGGQVFPFSLARGELAAPNRPQHPVPPFPYAEHAVTAENGDATLAGTLTIPEGDGPFPAVILVSGSGPQNRDEELMGHRPFAVWADVFARHGIATLRFDDRGVGESTGDPSTATTSTLASDAEAWVALLDARPDIRSIGMMGHSEGGLIAPMVAARNPEIDFVVMLAGPGVPGSEILVEQNRAIFRAAGAPPEQCDRIADAAAALFAAVMAEADAATIRERTISLVKAQTGADEVDDDAMLAGQQALAMLSSPWMREFLVHDPRPDLRRLKVPVLAVFGERDVQVPPAQNQPAVEQALREGGNEHATVRIVPGVNHLFQPCETGGPGEYESIEITIDPSVLDLVREWIVASAP